MAPSAEWQTVRLNTLLSVRWIAIVGQAVALLFVHFGLGYSLPLAPTMAMVAASAGFNIALMALYARPRRLLDREATLHLAFDIAQLAGLLYFTGGLENPFALLVIVPVTISATNLSGRSTIRLVVFAMLAISALAVFREPLPGFGRNVLAPMHLVGVWAALMLGIPFTALYSWRVAREARRRSEALTATQMALAREQKLSALGGLAAAAAHELGTPLGTISVIAKEMARTHGKDPALAEDVALLQSQALRCREILASLSQQPEASHQGIFGRVPLTSFIDEVAAPFEHMDDSITITRAVTGSRGEEPHLPRRPEILHSLGNFIENAIDFAKSRVDLNMAWDDRSVTLNIEDDGPGFAPDVLVQLGEPYVTRRVLSQEDRHHGGLGLGVFIAKTLLERTGATVYFSNRPKGGAAIAISWVRARLNDDDDQLLGRWP
jgi:two-component system sensor histidine kinase RegB